MNPTPSLKLKSLKGNRSRSRGKRKQKAQEQVSKEYSHAIYQKFLQILSKRRRNFLKEHLVEYYGKNFPIDHKDHYNFQEQWQNNRISDQKITQNTIDETSLLDVSLTILTIVAYFMLVWFATLEIFLDQGEELEISYTVQAVALIVALIDIKRDKIWERQTNTYTLKCLEVCKKKFFTIISVIYILLKLAVFHRCTFFLWVIVEGAILVFLYHEASRRYQSIRLMSFSLRYEYQTKVFDLVITIFIIAHCIAIVLFVATKASPESNWLTKVGPADGMVRYVYSFYFATTTILTVGYGDLLPTTPFEVAVVVLVQIFGIAMLGYIINEIGYCISSLRKGREVVERDLGTVEKLRRHYKMGAQLTHKVRSYLVNSKPDVAQLSPQQQTALLLKVNEELRTDLQRQNLISVVKSSAFFVCRWSYSLQQSVAARLIHVLFNPNDVLFQPKDRERIYIVKQGRVSVHVSRLFGNKRFKNALKTINNTVDSEVSDNCYGYTAAISTRTVNIFAVSKAFTSAYYIEKDKFAEAVFEKIPDSEFYHQIRSRIEQARFCEAFEVPSIESSKHHYAPTKYYIIRKHVRLDTDRNQRIPHIRRSSAFRGVAYNLNSEFSAQVRRCFQGSMADTNVFNQQTESDVRDQTVRQQGSNEEFYNFVMENNLVASFHHYFEASKEYTNFFPRCNRTHILKKYETEHFVRAESAPIGYSCLVAIVPSEEA